MLETLQAAGFLSPLDVHFARTVARIGAEERPRVLLAAALASRQVSQGHVCLDLPLLAREAVPVDESGEPIAEACWPEPEPWLEELRSSPIAAAEAIAAEEPRPLVVDARGRVYLHRYWDHQRRLAVALRSRACAAAEEIDRKLLRDGLDRLFPKGHGEGGLDRQRLAAAVAALRRLCVISGGPGTGKTHTVVKILALLLEQSRVENGSPRLRIRLLAPTGKAAARLGESIRAAKAGLECDDAIRAAIPDETATIHRCLGSIRDSDTRFRHDADTPLLADVVLVDEASMIALSLMARLTDALPPEARLILLGDKDQLASVEAGAVLGDICDTGVVHAYTRGLARELEEVGVAKVAAADGAPPLADCVVQLERSYRYGADSAIGRLARAVNRGDAAEALALLDAESDELALIEPKGGDLPEPLVRAACRELAPIFGAAPAADRLRALEHFRFLCAHRRGPLGVDDVNRRIEHALAAEGRIGARRNFYDGRPILVTENDYQVGLFNGDVGLVVAERGDARPDDAHVACFVGAGGKLRRLAPSRLPPHETAYAMTVHRSQGSEFDEIAVVLPEKISPVVTRELLYTAVTRARRKVSICASRDIVAAAVSRPIERASGLRDALWGE